MSTKLITHAFTLITLVILAGTQTGCSATPSSGNDFVSGSHQESAVPSTTPADGSIGSEFGGLE